MYVCVLYFLLFEGKKLKNEEERESLIIDCLVKLGKLDDAAKRLRKLILIHPDHWVYMKTYIRCQVQRCQNFRERVRKQVERDRKKRQQQQEEEATENGTDSSGESTDGDEEGSASRSSETEKDPGESRDNGRSTSRDSDASVEAPTGREKKSGGQGGQGEEDQEGEEEEEEGEEEESEEEEEEEEESEDGTITIRWGKLCMCNVTMYY